jgi:hypothetical protein
MRPNLSLETIAGALAVLGTSVILAACGGEDPKTPVNANEVNGAATEKAADGANHCGAGKDHKAGQAGCAAAAGGDAKPADTSAAGGSAATATPAATTPAAATPADAKPADPKAATGATPAPASTTGKKAPAAPGTPAKKGGSGSCGAGTCSAKK